MISDYDLRIAATEAAKALVAAAEALEDCGEQYLPTPERERKLRLWEKWHGFRRAAAACLVAALGLTGWLTADAQAREAFAGWVREVYVQTVLYRPKGTGSQTRDFWPGYLPKGYVLLRKRETAEGVSILFRSISGADLKFAYAWNGGLQVIPEQENLQHAFVTVNGTTADYWYSDAPGSAAFLLWEREDGLLFYLSGCLERQELIRIAESV